MLLLPLLLAAQAGQAQTTAAWAHASRAATQVDADALIDIAERADLDAVYLLVWYWGGQAFYETDLAPMHKDVEEGFDPLGYLLEEAHKRDIEVHAWYVNGSSGSPRPGAVFEEHPDWRMVDGAGSATWWYDLGKPEVRAFQRELMIDVLERYEVDGIHFDYIRHNGRETCYCDSCCERFREQYGLDPAWFGSDNIPYTGHFSSNPLGEPTTATVLARFSTNVPAVYLNELGEGRVLGLNYHAQKLSEGFAKGAVEKALADANTEAWVPVIYPPETAAEYRQNSPRAFADALKALGHETRIIDGLPEDIAADGAAALVCAYRVSEGLADELVEYVQGGGTLIVVDGPVFSMGIEAMQTLTGMGGTAGYFSETVTVEPEQPGQWIPIRDNAPPAADVARFQEAWEEFQMSGPTALVRDVYKAAKELKPEAKVTAAVFHTKESAARVYQDWYAWLDEGIVDYVIPMCYVMEAEDLEESLDEWTAYDPKLERILPGLSAYQRVEGEVEARPPDLVLDQTDRCLKRGASGVCYFSLHNFDEVLVDAVASVGE